MVQQLHKHMNLLTLLLQKKLTEHNTFFQKKKYKESFSTIFQL